MFYHQYSFHSCSRWGLVELQSAAVQDRLTALMAQLYDQRTDLRDQLLLGLAAVGRGGQGDLGQRIRDEILVVQSKNNAKVRPLAWAAMELCHSAHCHAVAQQLRFPHSAGQEWCLGEVHMLCMAVVPRLMCCSPD